MFNFIKPNVKSSVNKFIGFFDWNFTLNRKFTFQSAANVPVAMLKVLAYYAVFTPLSTWLGHWLSDTLAWNEYLVTLLNMLLNFATEYPYQKFVVFAGSIDSKK